MIYLTKPYFDKNELRAVQEVFNSGWAAGQGPKGIELGKKICSFVGCKYAIPVNNCTAGLHLALLAIGIKENDEILTSDFTFPASGHAIKYCNAIPRFVDVDLNTYNMDPSLIHTKINKRTKAIVVVHALGQMAQMDLIMKIAKKNKLKVIEDAACAMGATYNGKSAGTYGDIAVFSLHARKNITSGEGGIVITNNKHYAHTISSLSCFGMESAFKRAKTFHIPIFRHLGYNYKLSDINSAIAIEQLNKYPNILKRKKILTNLYNRLLKNNPDLNVPYVGVNNLHIYQTYAVRLNNKINRNKLIIDLKQDEIQTQIGTYASHIQPLYKSTDLCPNSLTLYHQTLALPLYYELKEKDVHYVVKRLNYHIQKQLKN